MHPTFSLLVGQARCRVRVGGSCSIPVEVEALDGFASSVRVSALALPEGVSVETVELVPGELGEVVVAASADATPGGPFVVGLEASAAGIVEEHAFELVVAGNPGTPDLAFGSEGEVVVPVQNSPMALAHLADGGLLVGGMFNDDANAGRPTSFLSRYAVDGSIDVAYGDGGRMPIRDGGDGPEFTRFYDIGTRGDGSVYVTSRASTATDYRNVVLRVTAQGVLDTEFAENGVHVLYAGSAALSFQAPFFAVSRAGGVLVGGTDARVSDGRYMLALTSSGNIDATFGVGGGLAFEGSLDGVPVIDAEDRVLVPRAEQDAVYVVRLGANGDLDEGFGVAGQARIPLPFTTTAANLHDLALAGDGRILGIGSRTDDGQKAFAFRLLDDGQLDDEFGEEGILQLGPGSSYRLQVRSLPDGRALVLVQDGLFSLIRLNVDGTTDESFGTAGRVEVGYVLEPKIVVDQVAGRVVTLGYRPVEEVVVLARHWL